MSVNVKIELRPKNSEKHSNNTFLKNEILECECNGGIKDNAQNILFPDMLK